jgi:hypothetical protein
LHTSSLSSSLDGLDVDEIDLEVEITLTSFELSESLHDESDDFLIFFFIFFFSLLAVFSLSTSLICGMIFSFFL